MRSRLHKFKLLSLLATFLALLFRTHLEYLSTDATSCEENGRMKEKLRRSRRFGLFIAAAATALIAVAPAAGEESKGSSAPGGATAESPSGQTESHSESAPPAEAAPPSTGWVPQGEDTETSSEGDTGARRGSSLGSGGGGSNAQSTSEESSQTPSSSGYYEEPTSSSGYSEPSASSTPPAVAEPASTPQVSTGGGSAEPTSTSNVHARSRDSAAVGAASAVARSEPVPVAAAGDAPEATTTPPASPHSQAASGIGALKLLVLIVGGFILLYAGGQLLLGPVAPEMPAFLRLGVRRLR